MMPDYYEKLLLNACQSLDESLKNEECFKKLALEMINDKGSLSSLKIIKQLGHLEAHKVNQKKIIELLYLYLGAREINEQFKDLKIANNVSIDDLNAQLNRLIGLDQVKEQVNNLMMFNKIQKLREKEGLNKSSKTLHMAFLGNPGTAKTTVARIVGKMYKDLGLLSKGHFIEVSRTDLIAEYQGQTAVKVQKLIQKAIGGVLFIDEAYSITENDKSDSYGKESLTELTKALEDYRDDLVVIVAGYPDLMMNFFASNPGLKSRFNTFIYFDDYSLNELVELFNFFCQEYDYKITDSAILLIKKYFEKEIEEKSISFSNGRMVRNFFDDVVMNQSKRLSQIKTTIHKNQLMLLVDSDIPTFIVENNHSVCRQSID